MGSIFNHNLPQRQLGDFNPFDINYDLIYLHFINETCQNIFLEN